MGTPAIKKQLRNLARVLQTNVNHSKLANARVKLKKFRVQKSNFKLKKNYLLRKNFRSKKIFRPKKKICSAKFGVLKYFQP